MDYIDRQITKDLIENIKNRPLTYLNGARQVGKSTLCKHLSDILPNNFSVNHLTFDTPLVLQAAKSEPALFVNSLPENRLNVIDEVQFAPEIFPYLKMRVDSARLKRNNKGLFLLTGSANLMALPNLSDALVGRMSVFTLYPLSASECRNTNYCAAESFFDEDFSVGTCEDFDILEILTNCTYPELVSYPEIDRIKWFDDYLTTILNRDVRSLSDLRKPEKITTLLSLLTMRTGSLINNTALASEIGVDYRTYEKMLSFTINSFMIFLLKPWAMPDKLNKRFTKSPKLYFTDCNFLSYMMKRDIKDMYQNDTAAFGHILENFAAAELLKQTANNHIELSYFRTSNGKEVDFVLENKKSEIIGIEVKSSASVKKEYLSGLNKLQELCKEKFKKGIILYTGKETLPLADKIWAVPIKRLWKN